MTLISDNIHKCITCDNKALWNLSTCKDCFTKMMRDSGKSIEERLVDVEIAIRIPHEHINNTVFG